MMPNEREPLLEPSVAQRRYAPQRFDDTPARMRPYRGPCRLLAFGAEEHS